MLLKTTLELKNYFSAIDKDYNFLSLKSFILDAERDIVIPEIGQEMYDQIKAAYDGNTLGGKLQQLHVYLQRALTHLALFYNSDSGSFNISDAGFYVNVSDTAKPVSDKKMAVFREGRAEAGYKSLDQALLFMEQNISDPVFAAYKESAPRLASGGLIISGPVEFTRHFSALRSSGTTFRAMLSAIDQAEQQYLLPILGDDLYEHIKGKILDGSLSDDERKLVVKLQKPLAYFAVAEAIPMSGFRFDGRSFSVCTWAANNDNVEVSASISDQRLSSLMNACMINGNKELSRVKTFLEKEATKYPLYVKSANTDYTNDPNDSSYGFLYL